MVHLTIVLDDDRVVAADVRYDPCTACCWQPWCILLKHSASAFWPELDKLRPATHFVWQVDGAETVSTLKAILEAETGIAAADQLLSFTGKGLADRRAAAACSRPGSFHVLVPAVLHVHSCWKSGAWGPLHDRSYPAAHSATLSGSSVKDGDLLMLSREDGAAEGAPPQSHPMAVDQQGNVLNPQVCDIELLLMLKMMHHRLFACKMPA